MDEGGLNAGLFDLLLVGIHLRLAVVLAPPRLRCAAEDLDSLRPQLHSAVQTLVHATGRPYVRADSHSHLSLRNAEARAPHPTRKRKLETGGHPQTPAPS